MDQIHNIDDNPKVETALIYVETTVDTMPCLNVDIKSGFRKPYPLLNTSKAEAFLDKNKTYKGCHYEDTENSKLI